MKSHFQVGLFFATAADAAGDGGGHIAVWLSFTK